MVGRITASLLEASENTSNYMSRALEFLIDNFRIIPTMGERMIILREIRKAQRLQQQTLANGSVVSMISIHREAVLNYLELLYGFGGTSRERRCMNLGFPTEEMAHQINYVQERWPS